MIKMQEKQSAENCLWYTYLNVQKGETGEYTDIYTYLLISESN